MRKLLVSIISVALCVVLVSAVAYAVDTYYETWGYPDATLFEGEDWLKVYTSDYVEGFGRQVTLWQLPGDHLQIVSLFKDMVYVNHEREPEDSGYLEDEWLCICGPVEGEDYGTGSWEANMWHYVEIDFYGYDSYDNYIAESSRLMSSPSSKLTAIHADVLGRLDVDATWSYAANLNPSDATSNMSRSDRCALNLLYHARLWASELSKGDYFPFLLLHKSGHLAKAVFPKASGEIRVFNIRLSGEGWNVEGIETIK